MDEPTPSINAISISPTMDWMSAIVAARRYERIAIKCAPGVYQSSRIAELYGCTRLDFRAPGWTLAPINNIPTWQPAVTFDFQIDFEDVGNLTFRNVFFIGRDGDAVISGGGGHLNLIGCGGQGLGTARMFLRRWGVPLNLATNQNAADARDTRWDWSKSTAPAWDDAEDQQESSIRAQPDKSDNIKERVVIIGSKSMTQIKAGKTGQDYLRNYWIVGNGARYGVWTSRANRTCMECDPNPLNLPVGIVGCDAAVYANCSSVYVRGAPSFDGNRIAFENDLSSFTWDPAVQFGSAIPHQLVRLPVKG